LKTLNDVVSGLFILFFIFSLAIDLQRIV